MGTVRGAGRTARRGSARVLRPAAALAIAAALLAACTPGGPGGASSPAPASSTAQTAQTAQTEPAATGAGRGDDADMADGGSTIVGVAPNDDGTGTLLEGSGAHAELGRGTGAPLAEGTPSAGLTWGDGTPVRLDVLSVSQARQVPAEELRRDVSEQWNSWIEGAPEGFSLIPASAADADGALERVLTIAISDAYYTADEGAEVPRPRAGYVDASGWHGGPQISINPFNYGSQPLWSSGGRLYWVDDGSSMDPDVAARDWSINSWAPGEKKVTVVADGKDDASLEPPNAAVVVGDSVYFSSVDVTDFWGATSLFSAPLKGGRLKKLVSGAGKPHAAGGGVVFERYFEPRTSEEYAYDGNALVASVQKLEPGKKPETLVSVSRAEIMRGLKGSQDPEASLPFDASGFPVTSLTLLSADADTVVLRQRGQAVILRPDDRSGTRLLPLMRASSDYGLALSSASCRGGTALLQQTDAGGVPVLFWLPSSAAALGWITDASPSQNISCAGNVLTLVGADPYMGDGTSIRVIRPST